MPIAASYLIVVVAVALLGFSVFHRFADDPHEAFTARLRDSSQTSFDRKWIQQVEYLNGNMLRVRFFSKTLEFLLSPPVMLQWEAIVPAHSIAPVIA